MNNPNRKCHIVTLGNHWNTTLPEYFDYTVSSLYIRVPFASTNFAKRHTFTLDLLKPRKQTRAKCSMTALHANAGCFEWREQFWDILNEELQTANFDAALATTCNGKKN
eukprot:g17648.t1